MVLSVIVKQSVSAASLPLLMEVQLQIKFAKYYNDTVFRNGPNHSLQVEKTPYFFLNYLNALSKDTTAFA